MRDKPAAVAPSEDPVTNGDDLRKDAHQILKMFDVPGFGDSVQLKPAPNPTIEILSGDDVKPSTLQRRKRSETVSSNSSVDGHVIDPILNRSLFLNALSNASNSNSQNSISGDGRKVGISTDGFGSNISVEPASPRVEKARLSTSVLKWESSKAVDEGSDGDSINDKDLLPRSFSRFANDIAASSFGSFESTSRLVDIGDGDSSDSEDGGKRDPAPDNGSLTSQKSLVSQTSAKSLSKSVSSLKAPPVPEGRAKQPVKKESPFYVARNHKFESLRSLDTKLAALLEIELTDDISLCPSDSSTFYPHDDGKRRRLIEFEVVDGKQHPKSATLPGLVDYLVAENGETDLTFLTNFLMTYLYFSEPTDVARLLILRYLECKERSLHPPLEDKEEKKHSLFGKSKHASKDKDAQNQPDWNSMVQLRILNIMRKWVDNHWIDFDKHRSLCTLMIRFLNSEVRQDPKKMIFVNSITQKLESTVSWLVSAKNLDEALAPKILTKPSTAEVITKQKSPLTISDLDPEELAREFTLIEYEKFKSINIAEFFQQSWATKDKAFREKLAPNLLVFISWFNNVAYGVASEVVSQPKLKERTETLKKFIFIAHYCSRIRNYNTCYEIVAGLNLACISKLKKNWKALPKDYLEVWADLNALVTNEGNYKCIRHALFEEIGFPPACPVIPYLGMFLSDLTFIEDGNPTYLETEASKMDPKQAPNIHFAKFRMVADKFAMITTYQKKEFDFKSNPHIRQWVEQNWRVLSEAELYKLAKECEAAASAPRKNSISNAAGSIRDLLSTSQRKLPLLSAAGANGSAGTLSKGMRSRSSSVSARLSHLSVSMTAQDLK